LAIKIHKNTCYVLVYVFDVFLFQVERANGTSAVEFEQQS